MKKNITILSCMVLTVIGMFLILTGSSYALINIDINNNEISSNDIVISFINTNNGDVFSLLKEYPLSEEIAFQLEPVQIKVTNTSTKVKSFKIGFIDDKSVISKDNCEKQLIDDKNINVSVNDNINKLSEKNIIINDKLGSNQSKLYDIRLWIDEYSDNSVFDKHFHKRLIVY